MHKGMAEDLGPPASILPPSLGTGPTQNAKLYKAVCSNWRASLEALWGLGATVCIEVYYEGPIHSPLGLGFLPV